MNRITAPWFTLDRHDEAEPGGQETPPEGGSEGKPAEPATFTQAQLDAIIADRLARQKAQFKDYDEVKAKAAKFDEAEAANLTEIEREREARTRAEQAAAEAVRTAAERIATAEIKAALTGLVDDPATIVEDLNLARYVTESGEVDAEAVTRLRDKYAALVKPGKPRGEIDQGHRGDGTPSDFRNADKATVDAELAKLGVRRW